MIFFLLKNILEIWRLILCNQDSLSDKTGWKLEHKWHQTPRILHIIYLLSMYEQCKDENLKNVTKIWLQLHHVSHYLGEWKGILKFGEESGILTGYETDSFERIQSRPSPLAGDPDPFQSDLVDQKSIQPNPIRLRTEQILIHCVGKAYT